MESDQCQFAEPWRNACSEPVVAGKRYCQKHLAEKCIVCHEQAVTRCCSSSGLMCGNPLCAEHVV